MPELTGRMETHSAWIHRLNGNGNIQHLDSQVEWKHSA